jgi:hypothetical protein
LDLVERLRSVLAFVGKRLAATDPALVPPQALDALNNHLQAMSTELQGFISDGQPGHLVNASNHGSEALIQTTRVPGPASPDDLTALSESAAGYRAAMERSLAESQRGAADIRGELAAIAEKVAGLASEVSTQRSGITTLSSEFQSQFSAAQEGRAREFTEQQGTRQRSLAKRRVHDRRGSTNCTRHFRRN